MKTLHVLQFLRPSGTPRLVETDMPDDVVDHVTNVLLPLGARITAEVIVPGEVCFTVDHPGAQVDIDMIVIPNGPGLQEKLGEWLLQVTPELVNKVIEDAKADYDSP